MYRNWYIVGGHIITDVSRKVLLPVNRYGIPNSYPKLMKK